jgi:peptidoglycan/xylan/chitin deacetylase (PgdA/CDA1 family)
MEGGSGRVGRDRATRPWVLMYHSIAPTDGDPFSVTVSPGHFERQMRWLAENGWRGVSVLDLLAARSVNADSGLVGLTFDDGYADFTTAVLPQLARWGFTATAYVVARNLGGYNDWETHGPRKQLMTAAHLREVAAAGMEVGSHGLQHVRLPLADDAELRAAVADSREVLSQAISAEVVGFSYPWGAVDDRTIQAVRKAGYEYACAYKPHGFAGTYALPRTHIVEADGRVRLSAKRLLHRLASRSGRRYAPSPPGGRP